MSFNNLIVMSFNNGEKVSYHYLSKHYMWKDHNDVRLKAQFAVSCHLWDMIKQAENGQIGREAFDVENIKGTMALYFTDDIFNNHPSAEHERLNVLWNAAGAATNHREFNGVQWLEPFRDDNDPYEGYAKRRLITNDLYGVLSEIFNDLDKHSTKEACASHEPEEKLDDVMQTIICSCGKYYYK